MLTLKPQNRKKSYLKKVYLAYKQLLHADVSLQPNVSALSAITFSLAPFNAEEGTIVIAY